MCFSYRGIVSEELGEDGRRDVLYFIGCSSLKNFSDHLKRNNCADFDVNKINEIISECPSCQEEQKLLDRIPYMTPQERDAFAKRISDKRSSIKAMLYLLDQQQY